MAAIIQILLWVLGCYALAAACVHAAFLLASKKQSKKEHYVLVAGNEQQRMEWYMRALRKYSHRSGKDVKVTVVDGNSQDDSLQIAKLFNRSNGLDVKIAASRAFADEAAVHPMTGQPDGRHEGEGSMEPTTSLTKWQRFRRRFIFKRLSESEREQENNVKFEPTHLMWMLQAEGIVTEPEHAVLVDLREPSDWSKLPL